MIFAKILLYPFSLLYGLIIILRNLFFDIGFFKTHKVKVPVISVGNLTAGGTGKTPIVEFFTDYLLRQNKKVGVVSRGYKRSTKGTLVVSDGKLLVQNASECGDEPYQIALKYPNATVIVDEDKYRSAKLATEKYGCDIILVDDGFQHRKLHRDLDIVVVDVTRHPFEENLLPAGLRREPLSALKRADAIIFSRWNEEIKFDYDVFASVPLNAKVKFKPSKLISFNTGETLQLDSAAGKKCTAFCGLGNPDSFTRTMRAMGLEIITNRVFNDHHLYKSKDINFINKEFLKNKSDLIITSEKDTMRLLKHKNELKDLPLYYIEISAHFIDGEKQILERINELLIKE
jgi:tetraacyldisaccharide 4'-kinase